MRRMRQTINNDTSQLISNIDNIDNLDYDDIDVTA